MAQSRPAAGGNPQRGAFKKKFAADLYDVMLGRNPGVLLPHLPDGAAARARPRRDPAAGGILADQIDDFVRQTAGHALRVKVTVEFGEAGKVEQEVVDWVNAVLSKIKPGWSVS